MSVNLRMEKVSPALFVAVVRCFQMLRPKTLLITFNLEEWEINEYKEGCLSVLLRKFDKGKLYKRARFHDDDKQNKSFY